MDISLRKSRMPTLSSFKTTYSIQLHSLGISAGLLFLLVLNSAPAQITPLSGNEIFTVPQKMDQALYSKIIAGNDALDAGLLSLAERFYREILATDQVDPKIRERIALSLCSALISTKRFEEAQQILDENVRDRGSEYFLRAALIAFTRGTLDETEAHLANVDPAELPPSDLSWRDILNGLLAESRGLNETAISHFKKAKEESIHPAQRAQIETFIIRNQVLSGETNEALANRLEDKIEALQGEEVIHQLIREYAIVLERLGRREQALEIIRNHLEELPEKERFQRDPFLFLQGLIASEKDPEGERALKDLVSNGNDTDLQRNALYLLANRSLTHDRSTDLEAFLQELTTTPETHSLLEEILYIKAYLALTNKNLEEAQQLLDNEKEGLIQQFPASPLADKALLLLAFIAWEREDPQYRIAADYLSRLRAKLPDGNEKKGLLGVMMADCYFLNGDFENASDAYGTALKENVAVPSQETLLFQQVLSEIKADRLAEATQHLDEAHSEITPMERWRAEWNLINALKDSGKTETAFDRIHYLLDQSDDETSLTVELKIRLFWLELQLLNDTGETQRTSALADAILDLIQSLPADTLSPNQMDKISAYTLLFKGEALILDDYTSKEAMQIFQQLRERYPNSTPAIQSYLVESRYLASINRLVDAQRLLIQLADTYPDNELAPVALYEAALNADLRGLDSTYQESLELLERLSTNYPESPLIFYVRLKQGDVLRKLNRFSDARQVYEILINQYPKHPERYLAELYQADCLLAQASQDENRLEEASAAFERLFDLPNLPIDLSVEAGWKWAKTLVRRGELLRAEEVYWTLISRFLKDQAIAAELGGGGRYWMTRSSLELGALLEQQGRAEEARKVYALIIEYKLPGRSLAKAKLQKLS